MRLHRICILGNVQHGDITLHCDGLNAIQSIEKCTKDSFVTKNNSDIINSLNTLRQKISLKINIAHISGHQDRYMAYHQLPKLEQLNVQADALPQHRARHICETNTTYRSTSLPFNQCEINLKTTTLGKH